MRRKDFGEIMQKRPLILGGLLIALLAYAIPTQFMKDDGTSNPDSSGTAVVSTNKTNNKGNARGNNQSQEKKNISNDKLTINNLKNNTESKLKSVAENNNPFEEDPELVKRQKERQEKQKELEAKKNGMTTKKDENVEIGNNVTAKPDTSSSSKTSASSSKSSSSSSSSAKNEKKDSKSSKNTKGSKTKKETRPNMKVKAIAETDKKVVAVIESKGKRVTAFIGTVIDGWTITDIRDGSVHLQNNEGKTYSLQISK